jgi:hypothetical protein
MSEETKGKLDKIYDDLKQMRDEIKLKLHLGGMELRDQWKQLDSEWSTWTHQLGKELNAKGEELEKKLREAGGEDLRKAETATRVAISKLERGFKEVKDKLADGSQGKE